MFLLTYKVGTSSQHIVKTIARMFGEIETCPFADIKAGKDLSKYDRVVFTFRKVASSLAAVRYKFRDDKLIFMTLKKDEKYPFKTAGQGFSEYVSGRQKFWIPLCSLEGSTETAVDHDVIGFYRQKQINTFGDRGLYDIFLENVSCPTLEYGVQTTDRDEFLSSITHFLYIPTQRFDTLPSTLTEAVVSGKQIIFPDMTRDFRDGGDDVKECIRYHKWYIPGEHLDNSDSIVSVKGFRRIWLKLIEHGFEYSFPRKRYRSFRDWYEQEIA